MLPMLAARKTELMDYLGPAKAATGATLDEGRAPRSGDRSLTVVLRCRTGGQRRTDTSLGMKPLNEVEYELAPCHVIATGSFLLPGAGRV